MRLKLTLAYDGAGFRGWAAQPGLRTVEAALREGLDTIFPSWSELAIAGRTDTGVHAYANVASIDADGGPQVDRVAEALNTALPADVAVASAVASSSAGGGGTPARCSWRASWSRGC